MSVLNISSADTMLGQLRQTNVQSLNSLHDAPLMSQPRMLTQAMLSQLAHESQHKTESAPTLLMFELFLNRFFNRLDAYYKWSHSRGHYIAVYQNVTSSLVESHLQGRVTLAVPALNSNGECKWCAWDSDEENGDLDQLEKLLKGLGWHPIREGRRPGRDGHLFLFFDDLVKASDLMLFDRAFRQRAKITSPKLEFFPKQAKADLGNALRLPLGFNRKPGVNLRGWFQEAPDDIFQQLAWFAAQPLNPGQAVAQIAHSLRARAKISRRIVQKQWADKNGAQSVTFEVAIAKTNAEPGGNGWWKGHCPIASNHVHGDRSASLGIKRRVDATAAIKCHAGCRREEIISALKDGV